MEVPSSVSLLCDGCNLVAHEKSKYQSTYADFMKEVRAVISAIPDVNELEQFLTCRRCLARYAGMRMWVDMMKEVQGLALEEQAKNLSVKEGK